MVIDDSEVDLYLAKRIITKHSFAEDIVLMDFAKDALEYLNLHANEAAALPEYIFLDVNMPGMNGFEFLHAFEQLPESVKNYCNIIMLTTSMNTKDKQRALDNPLVKQYINKPLSADKLEIIV